MEKNEDSSKTSRAMQSGQWFWIPKALIQGYAAKIGPIGIAVYNVLASMTDQNQECFPSQKYMADLLGYSRASINKALKVLKGEGLIEVKKRSRYHLGYRLIQPRCKAQETQMSTRGNRDVKQGNTNNNKLTRIYNYIEKKKKSLNLSGFKNTNESMLQTREDVLASDLAQGLQDSAHLPRYANLARKFPESLLRRVLSEAKEWPDNKIKKSRSALFNYLLKEYADKSFSSD
jgi:biotin operon repressor